MRPVVFAALLALVGCAGPRTVSVQVIDAETRQPVTDASVRLTANYESWIGTMIVHRDTEGITGTDGTVTLASPDPGRQLALGVEKEGYSRGSGAVGGAKQTVELWRLPPGHACIEIPNGFRGLVIVEIEATKPPVAQPGQRLFPARLIPNEPVRLRVPEGILFGVDGLQPCKQDGSPFPSVQDDKLAFPDEIRWRPLHAVRATKINGFVMTSIVGTAADYHWALMNLTQH